ncbi:hypothetical protein [Isoptericola hypogeus]|uniref:hypothetical protein n=1 Tax=Isoptericola hypogeus TaxID=300179 RepID=UPI0031D76803
MAVTTAVVALLAAGCQPGADAEDAPPTGGSNVSATGTAGSGRGVRGEPADEPTGGASDTPDAPAALPTFDPATTVGGYAPDFPRDLLGAPEDATVLASSVTPGDGRLTDVTLNLATGRSAQESIDQLAERLLDAGFEESQAATFSGLTAQTAFTRTKGRKKPVLETVLLGVLDEGDRRLVTVSGSLLI